MPLSLPDQKRDIPGVVTGSGGVGPPGPPGPPGPEGPVDQTNLVHRTDDESIAGMKTFTDPLAFEEEGTSPAAPASGSRFFTRAGKMWVRTPTTEYALAVESVAVSLLTNGDFETRKGAVGTEPTGWNGFWHGGTATLVQATDQVATGLGSAKAHLNATADDNVIVQTDAAFPVTPGGVLLLEFNARSGPQAGAYIGLELQTSVDNTGDAPNFFVPGTTVTGSGAVYPVNGWTHYVRQFPIPAGHKLARLCFRVMKDAGVPDRNTTQQDVWIDSAVAQMDTSASASETLEWRSAGMRDQYNLTTGVAVTIPFRLDYGGTGVTINAAGQLVISTPGTYHVVATVGITGTSYCDTYLNQWRGGTKIQARNTVGAVTGSGWDSVTINGDFLCQAGDIFEVAASSGAASGCYIEVNRSQFTIHKLAGPGPIGPAGQKGDKGDVGYAELNARCVVPAWLGSWDTTQVPRGTIDGVQLITGDRALLTGQTNAKDNGLFVVGAPWTRAPEADDALELNAAVAKIAEGTVYGGTRWQSSIRTTDVIGTTPQRWYCSGGDTGWIPVPFINGWYQYPGYDACCYRRLNGIVYHKGLCIGVTASTAIFVLPQGFRPFASPGPTHVVTSGAASIALLNQFSDGRVVHNAGPISWITLQSITPYPADN